MKTDARPVPKVNMDKVGAVASAICAVHCVLTGLALGLLSVVGLGFLSSFASEAAFIGTAVVVGIWAIVHGVRKHHSYVPASIFVLGLVCIALSHFAFGHSHGPEPQPIGATVFSVLGGLCLVTFHIVNLRLQHKCSCSHCVTGH